MKENGLRTYYDVNTFRENLEIFLKETKGD